MFPLRANVFIFLMIIDEMFFIEWFDGMTAFFFLSLFLAWNDDVDIFINLFGIFNAAETSIRADVLRLFPDGLSSLLNLLAELVGIVALADRFRQNN